jgi:hypothetical protein
MPNRLALSFIAGAAVAAAVTELLVFRYTKPPDASATVLGGLWLAMPYFVTVMLAYIFSRQQGPLTVLAVLLALAAFVGISFTASAVSQQAAAEQQAATAVLPGEDPSHGPAAMRKSGAEMGAAIGFGFLIVLAIVVPPVQTAVIVIPTVIAGVLERARERHLRQAGEAHPNQTSDK